MNWELITTILGSQSLIELLRWFRNRKTDARVEEAHADSEEFTTLSQTNLFLQQQLKDKEERFAQQTEIVRNQTTEILQLTKDKALAELAFEKWKADRDLDLERVRCNDTRCAWRTPPNAYTDPKPGTSKEDYHTKKKGNKDAKNRPDSNTL